MCRTMLALLGLLVLSACQGSGMPQTTAEKCSDLDMEIAATQENDSLEQDAKDEMIDGFQQQKSDLNCP